MLQEYIRDGQPAAEDDPPERVWAKVEFLRNYEVAVDAAQPAVLATANFDSQGKALNVQLRQGDRTSFEISDEAIMDFASAADLERQGIVKVTEKIYTRELRDYEFAFHNIYSRIVELEENIRNTDRDMAKANESIGKMREQIAYREQEKAKLNEDLTHLTDENTKLQAYQARLTTFRGELSGRLSGLYQSNNALEAELAEMQANLARMIEERASRAVAEVGTGAPAP
jgi:chromosome segregation ATPase